MDELALANTTIFRQAAVEKIFSARSNNQNFVHYTSADAAFNILKSQEVWLRNAANMNEYREVTHGVDLLITAWNNEEFQGTKSILNLVHDGIIGQVENLFDGWLNEIKFNTFMACVSEHLAEEDVLGRLSMWRAYGGGAGVALVFSGEPFFREDSSLNVFSSPVFYLDEQQFFGHFNQMSANIRNGRSVLEKMSREEVVSYLLNSLYWVSLTTKHPGFKEEREWRLTYAPEIFPSDILIEDIVSVNGRPEVIYKIPIYNQPQKGIDWLGSDNLIEKIIIGPISNPYPMYEAFAKLLERIGVSDPWEKVKVSEIPLRT